MSVINLDERIDQSIFGQLVGVSQQAISKLIAKDVLHKDGTLKQWLSAYCSRMREEAAGRGGDDQYNLSKARAEESIIKTAKLRLEYNREIGNLIVTEDAVDAINDWCRFANREFSQGTHRLVHEIQNKYKIEIEDQLVEGITGSSTERIGDYAKKISDDLVSNVD